MGSKLKSDLIFYLWDRISAPNYSFAKFVFQNKENLCYCSSELSKKWKAPIMK